MLTSRRIATILPALRESRPRDAVKTAAHEQTSLPYGIPSMMEEDIYHEPFPEDGKLYIPRVINIPETKRTTMSPTPLCPTCQPKAGF
jgi:hypothetical protein